MKGQLFAAFLPLVLFWAIEEFFGLKAALIAGCIAAVLELSWEWYRNRRISFLTAVSNLLVIGLGGVSFLTESGIAFKLQPMIMEWAMAVIMLSVRFRGGESFMVRTFRDSPGMEPKQREAVLANPLFIDRFHSMDTRLIVFLALHGLALGWAAIWGSTRIWILLKGVLFYVLFVVIVAGPLFMYKRNRGSD